MWARKTARTRNAGTTRVAARGDVAPRLTARGIEDFTVHEAVDAAVESKAHAVRDILARAAHGDPSGLVESFEAILAGASPDDVLALRNLLEQREDEARNVRRDQADGELARTLDPQPAVAHLVFQSVVDLFAHGVQLSTARAAGQYEKVEPLHLEAKAIREKVLGKEHPDTLASVNNLAELLHRKGDYAGAEPLYIGGAASSERV